MDPYSEFPAFLPKWTTRLRKRPQQPLTDLAQLYSKIANESIYFLKLEDQKDYVGALQGWKALNTDVLYQLTLIEHAYPNTQSYTKDEISLQNGVRELYHKSTKHLERLQEICKNEKVTGGSEIRSYTISSHSKKPFQLAKYTMHDTPAKKMATTLRSPHSAPSKSMTGYSSKGLQRQYPSSPRVNFTTSKPLETKDTQLSSESLSTTEGYKNKFPGFDDDKMLIDMSSSSEESSERESKNEPSYDVADYYDSYLDVEKKELARLKALDTLDGATVPFAALSLADKSSLETAPPLPPLPAPVIPKLVVTDNTRTLSSNTPSISLAPASNTKTPPGTAPAATSIQHMPKLKSTKSTPVLSSKSKKNVANYSNNASTSPSNSLTATKKPVVRKKVSNVAQTAAKKVVNNSYHPKPGAKHTKSTPVLLPKNSQKVRTNKTVAKQPPQPKKAASLSAQKLEDLKANSPIINSKVIRNNTATATNETGAKKTAVSKVTSDDSSTKSTPVPVALHEDHSTPVEDLTLKKELEETIIDSLQGVDKNAARQIFAEIVVHGDEVHWTDIAGLEAAKASLKEAVVYPFLRPDLFRGLREPVRGILLFGPPGTGKTMLARAVATESRSTFFSISASSLTSKYLGESEKLVRALFAVAKKLSPSIIFVDEIDSLMGTRNNEGENESSRRIKNEFLIQWSSLSSAAAGKRSSDVDDERVLVLAATNLPWAIDDAARRRFVRRQYIPLPESQTRKSQIEKLLSHQNHTLTADDFTELLTLTDGFSGSDITSLAKDAAMGPLRELGEKLLDTLREDIRPINILDFKNSLKYIKPSVSKEGLKKYDEWSLKFGSSGV